MRPELALALLLTACPDRAERGLRVPLPDGWHATPASGALTVGPQGHVVAQLESTSKPLPSLEALEAALTQEKVVVTSKEAIPDFIAIRYTFTEGQPAFLGVRRAGARTVWCASARDVSMQDVDAALGVCRALSWDN